MSVVDIVKSPHDAKGYRLTTELRVAEPISEVFDFFADAFQLETLTPPWLHFHVQTPRPIEMRAGALIDYRLRLHGLPLRWRSRISEWVPVQRFVDEQLVGPYRYWHHLHTFEQSEGATIVRDAVDYSIPLGTILHPLIVKRDLLKIFEFRQAKMGSIFTPVSRDELAVT